MIFALAFSLRLQLWMRQPIKGGLASNSFMQRFLLSQMLFSTYQEVEALTDSFRQRETLRFRGHHSTNWDVSTHEKVSVGCLP